MPDKSIPYRPVAMVCARPLYPSAPLPAGYAFIRFQPGMEDDWCAIQCSVRAFPDMEAARRQFDRELATEPELLARRLVFMCDSKRRAIATAALWQDRGLERVCWLAVVPGLHRRGLGKALVAHLMEIYREEGCTGEIRLTADTASYRAVNICRGFGFVPDLSATLQGEPQSELDLIEAWRVIDKRIADYERRHGAGVAHDARRAGVDPMDEGSGHRKGSFCRAFEVSAPRQSGDVPHYHDYSQVWYVTRGSCRHEVEGQDYEMEAGDVFFVPPKVVHRTRLRDGASIICCEFDMERVLSYSMTAYGNRKEFKEGLSFVMLFQTELSELHPKLTLSQSGQRQVERLMYTILEEYEAADEFFEDLLLLEVLQILLIFSREYAHLPVRKETQRVYTKYHGMVETAIRYIDEHFDEPLTLNGMCRISTVSKTYFCYIFKMLTHRTFTEYLMERRIGRAMTLLRETDLSIVEVGHSVGFHEPTHFSRTFKKLRGVSPREYRSAAKERPLEIG